MVKLSLRQKGLGAGRNFTSKFSNRNTFPIQIYLTRVETSGGKTSVGFWFRSLSYHCYIPSTTSTRHADTFKFFPKHFDFHRITNSAYLFQSAEDIISILSNKKSISSHPSLSFGPPIINAYLQVDLILQCAVQTPPTPPPHLTPKIDKLPSSFPRVHIPLLQRVNPFPLLRVPTSNPHRYTTRHTCHQQPLPIFSTATAVIDTNTGAKSSLQTHRSGP